MSTFKEHLLSFGITFVSTFFGVLGLAMSLNTFTFTKEAIIAVIGGAFFAAVRATGKVIYEVSASVVKTSNDIGTIQ